MRKRLSDIKQVPPESVWHSSSHIMGPWSHAGGGYSPSPWQQQTPGQPVFSCLSGPQRWSKEAPPLLDCSVAFDHCHHSAAWNSILGALTDFPAPLPCGLPSLLLSKGRSSPKPANSTLEVAQDLRHGSFTSKIRPIVKLELHISIYMLYILKYIYIFYTWFIHIVCLL